MTYKYSQLDFWYALLCVSAGIMYYGEEMLYVHWIICYLTGTATLEQTGDGFSALSLTLARAT